MARGKELIFHNANEVRTLLYVYDKALLETTAATAAAAAAGLGLSVYSNGTREITTLSGIFDVRGREFRLRKLARNIHRCWRDNDAYLKASEMLRSTWQRGYFICALKKR